MPLQIAIFGGGISGLTAAHELLDHYGKDIIVTIYEKNNEVGGMARSTYVIDDEYGGLPSEHSWRGYAPFYYNFFDMVKRIDVSRVNANTRRTVYDNLVGPINFILPTNTRPDAPMPTYRDWLIGAYYTMRSVCADERNDLYKSIPFKTAVEDKLSKGGVDSYIKMLGPGLGLDQDKASIATVAKFVETLDFRPWSVMNGPTNAALFDPWISLLTRSMGMNIQYNSILSKIHMDHDGQGYLTNNIRSCELDDGTMIKADIYIMAIDPYSMANIIRNSPTMKPCVGNLYGYSTCNGVQSTYAGSSIMQCPELKKIIRTSNISSIPQISFRFGFDVAIADQSNDVYAFPDSEFNITLYFQERFWSPKYTSLLPFKSYWSGTACVTNVPGPLYGKPAVELTDDQFLNECWYQISRSFTDAGGKTINGTPPPTPIYGEVWNYRHEPPKWSNTVDTYKYRPSQRTAINNMYLTGAHTKTTMDIYSMEGAAEAGKLVASMIIGGCVDIYKHTRFWLLKKIDNILYRLGLPSIVDVILFILCVIIAIMVKSWI